MEDERWLMMAVLNHLQSASQRADMNGDSLQEAMFAISNAYSLNMRNAATQHRYPLNGLSLVDVFVAGRKRLLEQTGSANGDGAHERSQSDAFERFLQRLKDSTKLFDGLEQGSAEYERRVERAREKFDSKRAAKRMKATSAPTTSTTTGDETKKERAEVLKQRGNEKLKEKKHEEALQLYDECIQLWPENAVYHSNRAAANMLLARFEEAVNDCRTAIRLDDTFMRPRERLAHAYRQMGRTADEVHALQQALKLDGANHNLKRQLDEAELRLRGGDDIGNRGGSTSGIDVGGGGVGGMDGANLEQMMSRIGRDGVSNMANMMGINVPSEALDELFENGGLQQMQQMMSRNPQMVQQTMQSLMRGELPTPFAPAAADARRGAGADA